MKTTPIIPRMWVATLPKDAPRLAHGPDRSLRLISPSLWERLLPIGSCVYVRYDAGARPFTRVYTEEEYREYWKRKVNEAFAPLGDTFLTSVMNTLLGGGVFTSFDDVADYVFHHYSSDHQLVAAIYRLFLGDLMPDAYDVSKLITDEDKSVPVEQLVLLPSNYASFRQRDMLMRIAFAWYYELPVASSTVTLVMGQLTASNDLHNFHKVRF